MEVSLLSREVSDLCIGKPALQSLPPFSTVADAAVAVKRCGSDPFVSVWIPSLSCAAKICMVDVICFLCADENIDDPAAALKRPVTDLFLAKDAGVVRRVEPCSSVLEALDAILDGALDLVVPIRSPAAAARKKIHHHHHHFGGGGSPDFCWLTQEDFVRYFLNSIAAFSPIAALSITALGLVSSDFLSVRHHEPALSILPLIRHSLVEQTSVAVVDDDGKLIGEISPSALAGCYETAAAALVALTAGELMVYIDSCGQGFARAVKSKLREKQMQGMLELIGEEHSSPSSSSDEELSPARSVSRRRRSGMMKMRARRSEEAVVCYRGSSLVAVMVQALAHRVSNVWVIEEDGDLVGAVTFSDVLRVFREQL